MHICVCGVCGAWVCGYVYVGPMGGECVFVYMGEVVVVCVYVVVGVCDFVYVYLGSCICVKVYGCGGHGYVCLCVCV